MKIRLLLPVEVQREFMRHLINGGTREIGGIMMGEHVGLNEFRLVKITCQMSGGSFARFVRAIATALRPLERFFKATQYDYTRFNYLGEWHSHPSFALRPSGTDCDTMFAIVEDPQVGAAFVTLLLVKLEADGRLAATVTLFRPGFRPETGLVLFE